MFARILPRLLPFLAVLGAALFVVLVILVLIGPGHQQAFLIDTGETRSGVLAALKKLQEQHPASIDDAEFRRSLHALVKDTSEESHIATAWLLEPDGQIIDSTGSTSGCPNVGDGNMAEDWASIDVQGVLDTLPEDLLSDEQRTMLLAASCIRSEGTHNDIYRHLLVPIRATNGSTVALVGVNFTVTGGAHNRTPVGLGFVFFGLLGLGGFALYWLSLPLWVFLDARTRGERAWIWAAFVFLGNLVALVAYLLAHYPRPQRTAVD